jgi:hypothetical protein
MSLAKEVPIRHHPTAGYRLPLALGVISPGLLQALVLLYPNETRSARCPGTQTMRQ